MNPIEMIKKEIIHVVGDCEINIEDDSKAHAAHYEAISETIPSHLTIKIISNYFANMNLVKRHRTINNIMKDYFDKGLHALKIIAITHDEQIKK